MITVISRTLFKAVGEGVHLGTQACIDYCSAYVQCVWKVQSLCDTTATNLQTYKYPQTSVPVLSIDQRFAWAIQVAWCSSSLCQWHVLLVVLVALSSSWIPSRGLGMGSHGSSFARTSRPQEDLYDCQRWQPLQQGSVLEWCPVQPEQHLSYYLWRKILRWSAILTQKAWKQIPEQTLTWSCLYAKLTSVCGNTDIWWSSELVLESPELRRMPR